MFRFKFYKKELVFADSYGMINNIAFNKRIVRDTLISDVGLQEDKYWGILEVSDIEINRILELGEVNESFIIN